MTTHFNLLSKLVCIESLSVYFLPKLVCIVWMVGGEGGGDVFFPSCLCFKLTTSVPSVVLFGSALGRCLRRHSTAGRRTS